MNMKTIVEFRIQPRVGVEMCVCYFSHCEDSLPDQRNSKKEDRRERGSGEEKGGKLVSVWLTAPEHGPS